MKQKRSIFFKTRSWELGHSDAKLTARCPKKTGTRPSMSCRQSKRTPRSRGVTPRSSASSPGNSFSPRRKGAKPLLQGGKGTGVSISGQWSYLSC